MGKAVKAPPKNTGREAVALRTAAIAFGAHSKRKAVTDHDYEGQRLNRALLKAAERYGVAVSPQTLALVEACKVAREYLWSTREECFLSLSDTLLSVIRAVDPGWEPPGAP